MAIMPRRQRYRSVLSQAGAPIKDAAMRKIVAGLATMALL
jgi:hypothetical protein